VLDLPGFGSSAGDATSPDIHAIGRVVARWLAAQPLGAVAALLGHSTGAQAALTAALEIQDARPDLALVLAGPTFLPRQRRLLPLAAATVTAYRRDSLRELVVAPSLARGRTDVVRVLRSGMRDAPDERIRGLRIPLTLTAGEADSFAPGWWLTRLAEAAVAVPRVVVDVLPGSHNNLFTHPHLVADTFFRAATGSGLPPDAAG
jgi:pimeloyl-ACP methyl ester carboxylesterase